MYKLSKSCENVSFPASSNAYGAKIVRLSFCKETQTISLAGKKLLGFKTVFCEKQTSYFLSIRSKNPEFPVFPTLVLYFSLVYR
jgi:hypothetical protein